MYENIINRNVEFHSLDIDEKFKEILIHHQDYLAKYIEKAWELRQHKLFVS